jgi:vanillate O-demethylase ferredoxin subunit
MTTIPVRVKAIVEEAIDIKTYELVAADGSALPAFTPGAHIDVHLGAGLMRQYSLCNDPGECERYVIAVKKEPQSRGGSRRMSEGLKPGDLIEISAPRNHFALAPDASHSVLLAGGIGITPLLAMARQLAAAGARFELHYFTRSPAYTAFRALLSAAPFAGKVHLHFGLEPDQLAVLLRQLIGVRPDGAHLYLCGPTPFMEMVRASAAPAWPNHAVHLEYFVADPAVESGPRESFQVKLARSGAVYDIPADKSIVQVLAEHGIVVDVSCEQGVCATCLTRVLEGTPDHRDVILTDEEKQAGDQMTICVSRSKSPLLVLDL